MSGLGQPVRVKICGIRRLEDALLAARLGADAIGVLVGQRHPSPDFLEPEPAAVILRALPPLVSGVLVSHCSSAAELQPLIARLQPAEVQLHSAIAPEQVQLLRAQWPALKLLKVVHGNEPGALEAMGPYGSLVHGFVADSSNPSTGQVGGTGRTHDWSISAALVQQLPQPLLLAGGLTPQNVAAAIATVRPWGVDVNSGVKGPDGCKDPELLEAFIQAAKGAWMEQRRMPWLRAAPDRGDRATDGTDRSTQADWPG